MAQQETVRVPKGWVQGTASDLVLNPKNDIVDGPFGSNLKASEYTDSGTPIVRIQNVKRFRFIDKNIHYVTDEKAEQLKRHSFKAGDILITKLGEPLGLACIAPQRFEFGIIVADIVRARPYTEISNQFITYLLNSKVVIEQISKHTKGSTRARINLSVVRNLNIPIPPLPEQKRIVEKLDSLLAQVDTIQQRLNNLPDIIKRFRQSVLAAAVSGKLTEQWRVDNNTCKVDCENITKELFEKGITKGNFGRKNDFSPDIDDDELNQAITNSVGWPMVRVGAICESVVPNRDKPKTFSGGFHWLLTPHFDEQSISIDYSKIEKGLSDTEIKRYKAKVIDSGSVVMTCVGRLGLSAVLQQPSVINQQLHAFIPNENILGAYLAYAIRANVKYYQDKSTSTTVSYLNKSACNSLPISLPHIEEQTEIVRLVEQYFALADTLEKNLSNAKKRVDNLSQSILAKAFRGELVPQDPSDEPAEQLLARIKTARLEAEKLEKAAKKAAKASKAKKKG